MFRVAPLSGSFMAVSMIGFIGSAFLMDRSPTWGFTLAFFFVIMFIASVISMTHAPIDDQEHIETLAVHDKIHRTGVHKPKE